MKEKVMTWVLIIEDNPDDVQLLSTMFHKRSPNKMELAIAGCMADAQKHLAEKSFDMILLDLSLPDVQGLESVRRACAAAPRVPVVVLSGLDDESMAIQALQEGAQDYLIKGQIGPRELLRALRYATARKSIEDTLFEKKERAKSILASIGDAVICTDISGKITDLNRVAEKLTGWSLDEACGHPMTDAFHIFDGVSRRPIPDPMELAVDQNRTVGIPHNTILVRRDGTEISVEDSVSPIHDRGGKVTGAVIVFRDVSALRAMTQQIAHSAQHDILTNLPNRSLLNDRIGQAIALARRHNHRAAILFLDLNGFKHINDSLGHLMGDKLIQSVGARLLKHMRGPDTVSRQGGDEFIVLLSEVREAEDAAITARRLVRDMEAPHHIDSHELHVTASIGISVYPDDGLDAETLIKNADTAMYQVKENVHAGFQFFKPAMNLRAVERQFLEENLRRALSRDEMALHYQPKINLKTGKIIGAEALLRWTHHDRGSISPAEFIPVAEESSLILSIGLWVVREACKQAQDWAAAGIPDMNIAVNVSSVQLRNQEFLPKLFEVLDKTGLDPKLLGVEVTEGLLMKRADFTSAVLQQLRERGIKVAIDDFGTGYSSLSYLHKFPLDTLKIDQSFVRQIASADGSSIVSAIISMGRDLGLRIVAEGVETREELAFLKAQRCDEAQGYYFSRPVPADAFTALLKAPAQAWVA